MSEQIVNSDEMAQEQGSVGMSQEDRNGSAREPEREETGMSALDRIRSWRQDYQNQAGVTPLENVGQLAAQMDLTHAHPSGIAQLVASGQVHLNALFRDRGMLRAAHRRLERVLDDQAAKERISG